MGEQQKWYENAVLYQVYPRSFQDSNGDGVGDLNGIRQRLGYLKDLGVDAVWISPFYPSPMKDFGYDIRDYADVDPLFGSLEDFDALLAEAHGHGLRVLIDLVPNHTSDQHPWFIESARDQTNAKADWYIWKDARADGSVPNNWLSVFGGSAWQWHEDRNQYYLHSFLKEQPDLNWENSDVREAFGQMMRFWLDKGVDGFRVDAIDFMGKDPDLPDELPASHPQSNNPYKTLQHVHSRDAGNFWSYMRALTDVIREYDDRAMVLEYWPMKKGDAAAYARFYRALDCPSAAPMNMELIFVGWDAQKLQPFLDAFYAILRPQDVPVQMLGNHDQPRFVSRVGSEFARTGAMLLLSLPGIAQLYNGEELGMRNVDVPDEQRTDPNGRDAFRAPMQWSGTEHAGFTTGEPWLPMADDYQTVNVAAEADDPKSLLTFYRALIRLRMMLPALHHGTYRPAPHIGGTVTFRRVTDEQSLLVLINFTDKVIQLDLNGSYTTVFSTIGERQIENTLEPYEGVFLEEAR